MKKIKDTLARFTIHDSRFTNKKGFTLIELAIVMVIIGLILGAIMKGQDLINNARAKKMVVWDKKWETGIWSFFDRKGRFPGDKGRNGIMGDETSDTDGTTYAIANASFVNAPPSTLSFGSTTFYVEAGYGTATVKRNVIVISREPISTTTGCTTALTTDELVYFEAIDTAVDGVADPGSGNVRGASGATFAAATNGIHVTAVTESGTANSDWSTTQTCLAYYFDKPR